MAVINITLEKNSDSYWRIKSNEISAILTTWPIEGDRILCFYNGLEPAYCSSMIQKEIIGLYEIEISAYYCGISWGKQVKTYPKIASKTTWGQLGYNTMEDLVKATGDFKGYIVHFEEYLPF